MKKLYTLQLGILFSILISQVWAVDLPRAQALFIYNFLRNVDWPQETTTGEYIIGIAGESDVYPVLKELTSNRELLGKKIRVIQCQNCTELQRCHVVFIPKEKGNRLAEINTYLKGRHCLTIFENPDNINSATTIDLLMQNEKLVFRVNPNKLKEQNLRLSSNVMDLSI